MQSSPRNEAPVTMLSVESVGQTEAADGTNGRIPRDNALSNLTHFNTYKVSKYYERGSVLFIEGQQPRGIYVLHEGRAKVFITSAEGKTLVLRIAQPGDLLGINSILTGRPHGASVQTLERCRIDFMACEHLRELLDRDIVAYVGVAQALSRKLNSVVEQSRLLFLSRSAAEKVARLLVKWCDEHGKRTAQGIRINSGLTHEEIGQIIGASRETVTRVLSEFKRRHIVSFIDNAILVRNPKALRAVAHC